MGDIRIGEPLPDGHALLEFERCADSVAGGEANQSADAAISDR